MDLDKLDIIYQKGHFVVWKGCGGYVVYNTKKPFGKGHTHLKSKKRTKEVIDNSLKKHFPLHWTNYFITSMQRLTTCPIFHEKLEHLRQTRKGKDRYYYRGR